MVFMIGIYGWRSEKRGFFIPNGTLKILEVVRGTNFIDDDGVGIVWHDHRVIEMMIGLQGMVLGGLAISHQLFLLLHLKQVLYSFLSV